MAGHVDLWSNKVLTGHQCLIARIADYHDERIPLVAHFHSHWHRRRFMGAIRHWDTDRTRRSLALNELSCRKQRQFNNHSIGCGSRLRKIPMKGFLCRPLLFYFAPR